MNRLALLLLLCLPSLAYAQSLIVGGAVSDQQVNDAQAILLAAKPKVLTLNVGEFELIEPAKGLGSLLWYPDDSKFISRVLIPANSLFTHYGTRRGEKEAKLHTFQPAAFVRFMIVGAAQGQLTTALIKSADKPELAPIVVDKLDITVGKPAPKPDDPPVIVPDDPLTQKLRVAANADYTSGKSDKKILSPLAGIFELASEDALSDVLTMQALDERLTAARKKAGIPEPELVYPTLRGAIQQEIYARLGINMNSGGTKLTDDTRRLAREAFRKIGVALETLAK